jgi:protein-disulfide isomerase
VNAGTFTIATILLSNPPRVGHIAGRNETPEPVPEDNDLPVRMRTISRLIAVAVVSVMASYAVPVQAQSSTVAVDDLMTLPDGAYPDVWLGAENAPVTIIEYASMTCPHCAAFANTVFDAFVAKYVDTGLVRYTMREFPIDPPNYPLSAAAFMLARCAKGETGYFAMIELLFAQQPMWAQVQEPIPPLQQLALQVGMSTDEFNGRSERRLCELQ